MTRSPEDEAAEERLLAAAGAWSRADPDEETRRLIDEAVAAGDVDALNGMFGSPLRFGTAGLRGALGAGPANMNALLCSIAAAAVAGALRDEVTEAADRGVVVGHDARHGSAPFAERIAEVLSANGIRALVIDGPAPTPLAAFAVRHLDAAAGLVVTASHNPPRDNGLKLYWSDGAQIASPVDRWIASRMDDLVSRLGEDPEALLVHGTESPGPVEHLGGATARTPLVEAYLRELAGLPGLAAPVEAEERGTGQLLVAHTALHGVGGDLMELAAERLGVVRLVSESTQRAPDPDFPTVEFPNPEEPGAMDAVLRLASEIGADAAVANDPDADRLALALPERGSSAQDGRWRVLTGDETGALLAWHLLDPDAGGAAAAAGADRLLATTVVSSRLVGEMASVAGVRFAETLTGFKHLCRPALEHDEWYQLMAYEEALGYAVGPRTRDKDGIGAALVACAALGSIARRGLTAWDVLDELARSHGAFVTDNGALRIEGPGAVERLQEMAAAVRTDPPGSLGGSEVVSSDNPAPDVIRLRLANRTRVVLRPSGTEPKFKYYCEAIEPVAANEDPQRARERARESLGRTVADLAPLLG